MRISNSKQIKIGIVLSYGQMAVAILLNLLYTPVMIRLLGKSEYGLYNTVSSTISTLSILSLGFNSSYIRYYTRYKTQNDQEGIAKLNGLFLIIFAVIGTVAFGCGIFLTENLHMIFSNGLLEQEYATAKILMILLTVNLSISFPMSVFSSIISAHEKFIVLKSLGILKTILGPLITLPLLLMGFRSVGMVAVTVFVSLVTDLLYLIYVLGVLKEKFIFHHFAKGLFKNLAGYTVFIAINLIVDQINVNLDKVLLGRFCGTAEVAVYSVGFMLYACYTQFSTSVSSVFTPEAHAIINMTVDNSGEQRRKLTELFTQVGKLQFLILALVASGYIFFGRTFITKFWVGKEYDKAYFVGLLLILPSSIALIQNVGIEIQRAENRHQFRSVVYLFMAIINLSLSIYLCQRFGAVGSAVGTAISFILANGLIMNIYYHKHCNIDIVYFWGKIGRMALGLVLPTILGMVIMQKNCNSLTDFIIFAAIYTAVYIFSMWGIGFTRQDRQDVVKRFVLKRHSKTIK